ncbi:hypothetical protein [Nocardioides turkmenicus]|uniref:hypothetical protein n=1 Tax=Nocardioides turkmenicus TaxID=2711220 RepID=UPI001F4A00F4|nr:hypothetical protein [Nocardioides sp. KC13]
MVDAALTAIESALQDLLATDPTYWRTGQKKNFLERLEKLQAQQAALKLRVLATASDIAEETGANDASGWLRTRTAGRQGGRTVPDQAGGWGREVRPRRRWPG